MTSTETFSDIAKQSQDLVTEGIKTWTETVQGLTGQFTGGSRPQLPDTGVAVDRVFDFYEQVLGHQREFVKTVVGATSSVVDQFSEQAHKAAEAVTEQAQKAAEAVTEQATQATEKVSETAQKATRARSTSSK